CTTQSRSRCRPRPIASVSMATTGPKSRPSGRSPSCEWMVAIVTRGRKIAYIADAAFHEKNKRRITDLVRGADHLFIEAAFMERDRQIAGRKKHLTAAQAGSIAAEAGVKRFTLFHFSPRYSGCYDELEKEAEKAFRINGSQPRQTRPGA
ncbi:MAG: MBL fold metallo-hydrolase, partial [Desulfosalsimonas sp.]